MPQKVKNTRVITPILVEDAKITYRNFAGEKRRYNALGDRNFHVVIEDEELATMLIKDGWNLKPFKPGDGEETSSGYHMEVSVNFKGSRPPKLIMVTEGRIPDPDNPGEFKKVRKGTILSETKAMLLDSAEITYCDLEIRPYMWGPNEMGQSGIKAYVNTLYAVIKADPFADKYTDIVLNDNPLEGLQEQIFE